MLEQFSRLFSFKSKRRRNKKQPNHLKKKNVSKRNVSKEVTKQARTVPINERKIVALLDIARKLSVTSTDDFVNISDLRNVIDSLLKEMFPGQVFKDEQFKDFLRLSEMKTFQKGGEVKYKEYATHIIETAGPENFSFLDIATKFGYNRDGITFFGAEKLKGLIKASSGTESNIISMNKSPIYSVIQKFYFELDENQQLNLDILVFLGCAFVMYSKNKNQADEYFVSARTQKRQSGIKTKSPKCVSGMQGHYLDLEVSL